MQNYDLMEAPTLERDTTDIPTAVEAQSTQAVSVSLEFLLYLTLGALVAVLRLANLNLIPLSPGEAEQALATWRILNPLPGADLLIPAHPLPSLAQQFSFAVLGGNEFAARLPTALVGVAVVLLPLLFRDLLGRTGTFLLSLMLFFSPVLLLATRFDSPLVWAALVAGLFLWGIYRYTQTQQARYGITATIMLAALIFLIAPGALLLAFIIVGALLIAQLTGLNTRGIDDEFELDDEPVEKPAPLRGFPWQAGAAIAMLIVVLVATRLMLYQTGLSSVGAVFNDTLSGFTGSFANPMRLYAWRVSLFYEPWWWVFGIVGLVVLVQRGVVSFVDRFLLAWLALTIIVSALFLGAGADFALWFTLPLSGLAVQGIVELLRGDERGIWVIPPWAKWLVAGVSLGGLLIIALSAQIVARAFMLAVGTMPNIEGMTAVGLILTLMLPVLFVIGFFLAANIWDNPTTARGLGLGVLSFGLLTSLATGINAATVYATSPVEFWQLGRATSDNTRTLSDTLTEVTRRETRGFPIMPVTVVQFEQDYLLEWLLRDFDNLTYVTSLDDAYNDEIILMPAELYSNDPPLDLGNSYTGQDFVLTLAWDDRTMRTNDVAAWWLQRRVRVPATPSQRVILLLRADVYQGVEFETDAQG